MGNKPSIPSLKENLVDGEQSTPPAALPPVCDSACQRQTKIDGLNTALEAKSLTKDTDPIGYQQARIAYFTEVEGQDWLDQEKERIRRDEIEPVMSRYRAQFDSLKDDTKNQGVFVKLMNALKSDQGANEEQTRYLNKRFRSDADKTTVLNRLNELGPGQPQIDTQSSYLPMIIDAVLAVLGLFIVYTLYSKFFGFTASVGGKRVLNKLIR